MEKEEDQDLDMLVTLRARLGHELVDTLIERRVLSQAPLSPATRRMARELLKWEPSLSAPAAITTSSVERLRPEHFLSDDVPGLLRRLAEPSTEQTPRVDIANETEVQLLALAKRAYPALIASANPRLRPSCWGPIRLRTTDEHRAAMAAMKTDPDLGRLWDGSEVVTSFGQSKTWLRINDPVELLIHGAWRLCLLRGDWSWHALSRALIEQTVRLRAAAKGATVDAPVFLGFGSIQVAGEVSHGTVHVRPYRGSLQSWLVEESDRLDTQGGGVIVELTHPWSLHLLSDRGSADSDEAPLPGGFTSEDFASFHRWADCFAVAVAMAQTPELLRPHHVAGASPLEPAPQLRWMLNADPLFGATSLHFSQGWVGSKCPTIDMSQSSLDRVAKLHAIEDGATRIAIRRLAAALKQPRRWSDALLDAVIAWEALSGNCRGGVKLQVSSVLAHLVSEQTDRSQMRAKIRRLYESRNKVVHGGDVSIRRDEPAAAALIGLTALRSLMDDFADLIGEEQRFEKLCLDSN